MNDDDIIYHYTSASVLQSIIVHKQFWATDIEYMNDAQELTYAKEEAIGVLQRKAAQIQTEATAGDEAAKSRLSVLDNIMELTNNLGADHTFSFYRVYAVCFCEDGDLLSQWRAYGGDDNYAIGFKRRELQKIVNPFDNNPIKLEKVIYGSADATHILSDLPDQVAQYPTGHPGVTADNEYGLHVVPRLAKIKNPAFKEEAEWRIMTFGQDSKKIDFRTSKLGLIPYIKLDILPSAIADIKIGPGPNQTLKKNAVMSLVTRYEPDLRFKVSVSESPLRR